MEIQLYVYEWHPKGGGDEDSPCSQCTDMEGTYIDAPSAPHQRCFCDTVWKPDVCTLQVRSEQETSAGEPQAEVVDFVQPGSSTNINYATSRTSGAKAGGKLTRGGVELSGELSETETESRGVNQNVAHNPTTSDGPQVIVNFYQSYQVFVLEQWSCLAHGDVWQSRTETRSRLVHQQVYPAGSEPYEMPSAGSGSGSSDDFDFTDDDLSSLFDE